VQKHLKYRHYSERARSFLNRSQRLSTGLTRFTGPGRIVYASVKGAVEVLTRYLAEELGPGGITVDTIAPGAVATDFSGRLLRDNEQIQQHIVSLTALGRYAVADDIGGTVFGELDHLRPSSQRFMAVTSHAFWRSAS